MFKFGSQEIDNFVSPHIFERGVIEVSTFDPGIISKRKTTYSSRQMDMNITFQVSTEGMDSQIDTGYKSLIVGQILDNISCYKRDFVHKVAIDPEEVPESSWHGKSNMLPCSIRERVEAIFNPVISGFFTTGWTESGFTGMRCLDGFAAGITDKEMVSK